MEFEPTTTELRSEALELSGHEFNSYSEPCVIENFFLVLVIVLRTDFMDKSTFGDIAIVYKLVSWYIQV